MTNLGIYPVMELNGYRVVNGKVSKLPARTIPVGNYYDRDNIKRLLVKYAEKVTYASNGNNSQVNVEEFMKEEGL